ncbi:Hsp33 family molecular chaperone HslO [Nevskia soli]|uniref:Hsp33 family molecular chaperone HslO n=1 Tax=Nevskia soli TaxID=418856 RepID=UPI0004A711A4|nr:Hsp33 family molecular chaperone HslO [Nevskia soli]
MNRLTGFVFENKVAHGAFVELSEGVGEMLGRRAYSGDVRKLLGEAMAAMPLLATHLGYEGRINLQFQGEDAVKMLVAQVDHHLEVRAMAKAPEDLQGSFTGLLRGGVLALMLEPNAEHRESTQASVPIEGTSLAQALEAYFTQSEQLPTLIRLAADGDRLRGFLLQRMPLEDARGGEEDWEHVSILAATLKPEEMLQADLATLLGRLFAEEEVRVFEPRPVTVACRCSRAGISRLLLSLGREECDSILAEQGRIAVTCEFCGKEYAFTQFETAELFAAAGAVPSTTRH